jgi:hypothetical protein
LKVTCGLAEDTHDYQKAGRTADIKVCVTFRVILSWVHRNRRLRSRYEEWDDTHEAFMILSESDDLLESSSWGVLLEALCQNEQ